MSDRDFDLTWTPFLTLVHRDLLRFWRVITQTLVVPLVNTTLYLMIFGVSLGKGISLPGGIPYLAFLIPGLVMMAVLNNSFQNSSSSIATSRFHGELEDLRVVPLSPLQITAALGVGGVARGVLVGIVTWLVGEEFYHYTGQGWLGVAHPLILALFLCLGGLAFAFLGVVIAFWSKSIDQLSLVGGFIILPLLYLGGVFFPLERLSPAWRTISTFNPMLYFINGVRYGILGSCDVSLWVAVSISFVTLILLMGLAFRTVRRSSYGRW